MFVFFGKDLKVVVPENRIYKIQLEGKKISFNFDGGECNFLEDSGGSVAPKIESLCVEYKTEEIALDILRAFYAACIEKKGAFYF